MASIRLETENLISREELRTFYLTGSGLDALRCKAPIHPALLQQLELPRLEHCYPVWVSDSEPPQPLFRHLQTLLGPVLLEYAELIVEAFAELMPPRELTCLSAVAAGALATAKNRLEMLHLPPAVVEQELEALRKSLHEPGWLVPFGDATLTLLSTAILERTRRVARAAFAADLEECRQRLRELLTVDDRKSEAASTESRVAGSLGARASLFLNTSALARALRRRADPTLPMDPGRRARCESSLATIEDALHNLNRCPPVFLVHATDAPGGDACAHALDRCRKQMEQSVSTWKAIRTARLEVESAFDPAIHLEALDAFDWSTAQPRELAALPVIVVLDTADRIQQSLTSFDRLLKSGLPVQVWITAANPAAGLGCLPLAYQDSFVLQSSLASVEHFVGGLSEMAQTLRPAVAVIPVSSSWTEAALLPLARSFPLYRYQPDRGERWHERFSFESRSAAAGEQPSFVHLAALMPAFSDQFRILPESAGPVDPAFPVLPVTDEEGALRRAVFTRELVKTSAVLDRSWRLLAELGVPGVVKEEAKEVDPAAADRARLSGATEAIHRVIALLTNA